jgi:hypothetical protein
MGRYSVEYQLAIFHGNGFKRHFITENADDELSRQVEGGQLQCGILSGALHV